MTYSTHGGEVPTGFWWGSLRVGDHLGVKGRKNLNPMLRTGWECWDWVNLLKPTGHVMHRQFNIQQLYVLPTLYLCVLYLSENKQQLVPLTA